MRRAQGAIEYLFMIAAALIIIAVVIKYLRGSAQTAGQQANETVAQAGNLIQSAISSEISSATNE
ncbi:class III signal peptide-containing protein [Pyrococcus abyssi]|uniref:class III signal peptide-containing protein n=1 Tax=Pyrococcus abyssi TaxID=29292 RepID=UPI00064F9A1F|nr:class III signal peptide-containing protein [Pyrococcus abyssi]